jgi:hypothetical protein
MNERRKIEDRLRRKEQEIDVLRGQIREAEIYIQALQDVLKLLPRERDISSSQDGSSLRAGSSVARARDIILAKGTPVHVVEILRQMGSEITRATRAALGGSISAYVRKGEIFTRPAPNTFGLVELGHEEMSPSVSDEPPDDFGEIDEPPPP